MSSQRPKCWYFVLFYLLIFFVLAGVGLLIGLIPLVGAIVLLVFLIKGSDADENEFGPNPKGVAL